MHHIAAVGVTRASVDCRCLLVVSQVSNSDNTGLVYARKGATDFQNVANGAQWNADSYYCNREGGEVMSTILNEGIDKVVGNGLMFRCLRC